MHDLLATWTLEQLITFLQLRIIDHNIYGYKIYLKQVVYHLEECTVSELQISQIWNPLFDSIDSWNPSSDSVDSGSESAALTKQALGIDIKTKFCVSRFSTDHHVWSHIFNKKQYLQISLIWNSSSDSIDSDSESAAFNKQT